MAKGTWKDFESSGKVSDYLAYRQCSSIQEGGGVRHMPDAGLLGRGTGAYGTERGSDRDGFKRNADWGMR